MRPSKTPRPGHVWLDLDGEPETILFLRRVKQESGPTCGYRWLLLVTTESGEVYHDWESSDHVADWYHHALLPDDGSRCFKRIL